MNKKYKNSLVLGKFYPPHKGHIYLIDTAIENSETVHVFACYNDTQTIPGSVRYSALKSKYKDNDNVIIYSVDDGDLPQHEYQCETLDEFYGYWVPFVENIVDNLDCIFTSENYGDDFARYLGIEHFLVDLNRTKYPISGTEVRSNPLDSWEFIPTEMRPYFTKRIVIMGPESCGKSTLAKRLAEHYSTNSVREYGRDVWEKYNGNLEIEHFKEISIGRQELEDDIIKESNKVIFCDTEDITTYIFSKMYCPETYLELEDWFLDRIENQAPYDMYILLSPDCDAIQDGTRQHLDERMKHFEVIKKELQKRNTNYKIVGGSWENRYLESIKIIDNYL